MPRYLIGSSSFASTPSPGHPALQVGTGPFGGGGTPDYQGSSALGINMPAGYGGFLLDCQVGGVSKFLVDATAGIVTPSNFRIGNNFNLPGIIGDVASLTPYIQFSTAGTLIATSRVAADVPWTTRAVALATGNLLACQDSAPVTQFAIGNAGTGAAPKWALRVAPTANAESMAQAHVSGASTGKAIQVTDNTGTTIGWLDLRA